MRISHLTPTIARPTRRQAFTLVELLVVVAIIAVLIAVLLPALNKAQRAAKQIQCLSTLRQYHLVNQMYANENNGYYIPIYRYEITSVGPPAVYGDVPWVTDQTMRQYLSFTPTAPLYYAECSPTQICPDATWAVEYAGNIGYSPKTWVCMAYSYGFNMQDFDEPLYEAKLFYPNLIDVSYKQNQIKDAIDKFEMGDGLSPILFRTATSKYVSETPSTGNNITAYRHNNGANFVFFDGHGEWLPRNEVDSNVVPSEQAYKNWDCYYQPPH